MTTHGHAAIPFERVVRLMVLMWGSGFLVGRALGAALGMWVL